MDMSYKKKETNYKRYKISNYVKRTITEPNTAT